MTNNFFETVFNERELSIEFNREMYSVDEKANKMGDRFLETVGLLSENEQLGVRLRVDEDKRSQITVFSSRNVRITDDDYQWIFGECATVVETMDQKKKQWKDHCQRYYMIQERLKKNKEDSKGEDGYYDEENESYQISGRYIETTPYFFDFFEEIFRLGGMVDMRIGAGGCRKGFFIIALKEEMTIRMKTMLALAIPQSEVIEIKANDIPHQTMKKDNMCICVKELVEYLMKRFPEEDLTDESEIENEQWEDEPVKLDHKKLPASDISVEELCFLYRETYKCLAKYNVQNLAQLRRFVEEKMEKAKMSGASRREIIKKISEYRSIPDDDPLTEELEKKSPKMDISQKYFDMLGELIGLDGVKKQVKRITAFARMKQDMIRLEKDMLPIVLNMEFVGNPGTAKTTVARILAGIFHDLGLITEEKVLEVGRADLVGKYIGHTADNVKNVFEKAKGRLLLIDEAYSLVSNDDFGKEAINTIVQEMENRRDETIVIFAGYPDQMASFIDKNPGLNSRIPFRIEFSDYTVEEMSQIVALEAKKRGFTLESEVKEKIAAICSEAVGRPKNGNGRFCRNLVEGAILNYADRNYGNEEESSVKDFVLRKEDFEQDFVRKEKEKTMKRTIGF